MDIEKLTKVYVRIRDARAKATAEYEKQDAKMKADMERIGNELLRWMQENKLKNVRTELGTVYVETDLKPSAADWDAVYRFITDNDAFDLLERRLKKTFVKEYMEANEGAVPPGVNVHQELVARVRRS